MDIQIYRAVGLALIVSAYLFAAPVQAQQLDCTRYAVKNPYADITYLFETLVILGAVANADKSSSIFYRLPLGYLTFRNSRFQGVKDKKIMLKTKIEILNFTFWMPEKRYVETNVAYAAAPDQVCEYGRPQPNKDHYLVQVVVSSLDRHSSVGLPEKIPEKIYALDERLFKKKEKPTTIEYGLIRNMSKINRSNPDAKPRWLKHYRHPEGHPYQVYFKCHWRVCEGYVYFPTDKLFFSMQFERKRMPNWRKNVAATLELLESWQIKAPRKITKTQSRKIRKTIKGK